MKPPEIPVIGKDYFAWPYEGQTKIKHKVFGAYWKIWVSKLGCYSDTMFMDCHGGCGAYIEGDEVSYGSSIIADTTATEVNCNRKYRNYICVCEKEAHNLDNLKSVWVDQRCSKWCSFKNQDFNEVIFDKRVRNFYSQHPALFLIDPFGYDLKMKNFQGLLVHKGNEIIINFMFDYMNRFLSTEGIDQQRDEYFGSEQWREALKMHGRDREIFLVELYKQSLKAHTRAKFVFAYRLSYPDKDQTYYYLIHATNDIQGITHMKNSFACVNNGRVEYLGKKQDNLSLFDLTTYKTAELVSNSLKAYHGRRITFLQLWEAIVEDIPYIEKDLSEAIHFLEDSGKLAVQRVTSKRGSYRGEDIITFGDEI